MIADSLEQAEFLQDAHNRKFAAFSVRTNVNSLMNTKFTACNDHSVK